MQIFDVSVADFNVLFGYFAASIFPVYSIASGTI